MGRQPAEKRPAQPRVHATELIGRFRVIGECGRKRAASRFETTGMNLRPLVAVWMNERPAEAAPVAHARTPQPVSKLRAVRVKGHYLSNGYPTGHQGPPLTMDRRYKRKKRLLSPRIWLPENPNDLCTSASTSSSSSSSSSSSTSSAFFSLVSFHSEEEEKEDQVNSSPPPRSPKKKKRNI